MSRYICDNPLCRHHVLHHGDPHASSLMQLTLPPLGMPLGASAPIDPIVKAGYTIVERQQVRPGCGIFYLCRACIGAIDLVLGRSL